MSSSLEVEYMFDGHPLYTVVTSVLLWFLSISLVSIVILIIQMWLGVAITCILGSHLNLLSYWWKFSHDKCKALHLRETFLQMDKMEGLLTWSEQVWKEYRDSWLQAKWVRCALKEAWCPNHKKDKLHFILDWLNPDDRTLLTHKLWGSPRVKKATRN